MKTFSDIIQDLRRKIFHPVYFLSGEEPYYIDQISDYIEENVLSDEEKEFNLTILYGRETNVDQIIDCCKRYPMLSNYQVVIVKEAQNIKEKDLEKLIPYIENPLNTTILVVCYKYSKFDKRRSFTKLLEKKTVFFESPVVFDNQVPAWITSYMKDKGYTITHKAAAMMAEYLGTDLSKIVNEISKLILNFKQGTEITPEHIEANIGISKDYNVFELQKAIGTKNTMKAYQIIKYFGENEKENPMIKVISLLYSYFSKVYLYHHISDKSVNNVASLLAVNRMFVEDYAVSARNYSVPKLRQIFSILREYDLKCKGVTATAVSDGELFKEMIYRIMN